MKVELSKEAAQILMHLVDGYKLQLQPDSNVYFDLVRHGPAPDPRAVNELGEAGFLKGFANGGGYWVSDEGKLAFIKSTDELGDGKVWREQTPGEAFLSTKQSASGGKNDERL